MAECTSLVYDPYSDRAAVRSLALSDDGKTAFSGMNDGSVRVWDLDRQAAVRRLTAGRNDVAVALTPSGRRAASLCDSRVKIWDVASVREVFSHALERQVQIARGAGSVQRQDRRRRRQVDDSPDKRGNLRPLGRAESPDRLHVAAVDRGDALVGRADDLARDERRIGAIDRDTKICSPDRRAPLSRKSP